MKEEITSLLLKAAPLSATLGKKILLSEKDSDTYLFLPNAARIGVSHSTNYLFSTLLVLICSKGRNIQERIVAHVNLPSFLVDAIQQYSRVLELPPEALCVGGTFNFKGQLCKKTKRLIFEADAGSKDIQPLIEITSVEILHNSSGKPSIIIVYRTHMRHVITLALPVKGPFKVGVSNTFESIKDFLNKLPKTMIYFDRNSHLQPLINRDLILSEKGPHVAVEIFVAQLRDRIKRVVADKLPGYRIEV